MAKVDKELVEKVRRARRLRLTWPEIVEATGIDDVTIWRWTNGTNPSWERRQAFMEAMDALIRRTKDGYRRV